MIREAFKGGCPGAEWSIDDERRKGGRDDSQSSTETRVAADPTESRPQARHCGRLISGVTSITALNVHTCNLRHIPLLCLLGKREMIFKSIIRDRKCS